MIFYSNPPVGKEPEKVLQGIRYFDIDLVPQSLKEMPHGDYAWGDANGNSLGLERKELNDLINSANSGHLENQLAGMMEEYDKVVLLGERCPVANSDGYLTNVYGLYKNKTYASIPAMMISLQGMGVDVLWSHSQWESGLTIGAVYKYCQKTEHTLLRRYVRHKAKVFHEDTRVAALLSLARSANARLTQTGAIKVIERYKTVRCALDNVEEWGCVPGIGKATVEKMGYLLENNVKEEV